jgi:hypothetical protein
VKHAIEVKLDLTAPGSGIALLTGPHGFEEDPQDRDGNERPDFYGTAPSAVKAVHKWLRHLGLDAETTPVTVDKEY